MRGRALESRAWISPHIVTALVRAGLQILHLEGYPEPFWYPDDGVVAAARDGRLPNSFSLLARPCGGRVTQ
ncbi:hypothetical protein [Actinoplanes campanulatus]|uniref:hypothetical protein n=1 Tax=Actinoplanes campanulatus TaxID=113559 RepID=UPI0019549DF1|nr:hypothetical protein [Actinoplanes capillaceus]